MALFDFLEFDDQVAAPVPPSGLRFSRRPLGATIASMPGHPDNAVAETLSPALGARTADFSHKVVVRKASDLAERPYVEPVRLEKVSGGELASTDISERAFAAYQDLEAQCHPHPCVSVEPKGNWGEGSVALAKLPTEKETDDNIVAFWRTKRSLAAGCGEQFPYRLSRPDTFRRIGPKARVVQTMAGLSIGKERELRAVQFILEYSGAGNLDESDVPVPALEASQGRVSEAQIQLNRESGRLRITFKFCSGASESAELRLAFPGVDGGAEPWLYRWTKGMHQ